MQEIDSVLNSLLESRGSWDLTEIYRNKTRIGTDRIYRAVHSHSGTSVAVKQNASPDKNRQQFKALSAIRAATKDCVAPLGLAPDSRFFVMEWVDAPPLQTRMTNRNRESAIARAGKWLRAFHDATVDRTPNLDQSIAKPALLNPQPCEGSETVLARLEDRRGALPSLRGRRVLLHTDFQLHNLFDTGDRLLAFDPATHRTGDACFDISRFLIGMELFRRIQQRLGRPKWPGKVRRDRRIFLEAYGDTRNMPSGLLDFVEDLQIARLWHNVATKPKPDRGAKRRIKILGQMLRRRGLLNPGVSLAG